MSETQTEKPLPDLETLKKGWRRAHKAAFYANIRSLLAYSFDKDCPVLGFMGVVFDEQQRYSTIFGGMSPILARELAAVGMLQGEVIQHHFGRAVGDKKLAGEGDRYDPAVGGPRCLNCDDEDPTGAHANKELEENARAFLGVLIGVVDTFYGEHLPAGAVELVNQLREYALPADSKIG